MHRRCIIPQAVNSV